jgi:hypothetical protein
MNSFLAFFQINHLLQGHLVQMRSLPNLSSSDGRNQKTMAVVTSQITSSRDVTLTVNLGTKSVPPTSANTLRHVLWRATHTFSESWLRMKSASAQLLRAYQSQLNMDLVSFELEFQIQFRRFLHFQC